LITDWEPISPPEPVTIAVFMRPSGPQGLIACEVT